MPSELSAIFTEPAFFSRRPRRTEWSVSRAGMTLVEVTVTLAIVGILAVIVSQCIVWSLQERARLASHQAALELADNLLEMARAQPWERLDQSWADAQAIPAEM